MSCKVEVAVQQGQPLGSTAAGTARSVHPRQPSRQALGLEASLKAGLEAGRQAWRHALSRLQSWPMGYGL